MEETLSFPSALRGTGHIDHDTPPRNQPETLLKSLAITAEHQITQYLVSIIF